MFEQFGDIKEELAVSIGGVMSLLGPAFKMYVASINRRFAEYREIIKEIKDDFEKRIQSIKDDSEEGRKIIYAKIDKQGAEIHEIKADVKVVIHALQNGFKNK